MAGDTVRSVMAMVAPGTTLRAGLERILAARTGALIVLGTNRAVEQMRTGGFDLNTACTATALRELSKMDGAIIVSQDLQHILAAGVHLMPDAQWETTETGTRHRTADRTSQQSGLPVVTVSSSAHAISVFVDGIRHPVEQSDQIISRANQALAAFSRYQTRLWEASHRLSVLEIQDQVTVRDVCVVVQRLEMLNRLGEELHDAVITLGSDGRLLALQVMDLEVGLTDLGDLLELDYCWERPSFSIGGAEGLTNDELLDLSTLARSIGFDDHLDARVAPRGHRQLAVISQLPRAVATRLLDHFDGLQGLMGASNAELMEVEGIGANRSRLIRDGLIRLTERGYDY